MPKAVTQMIATMATQALGDSEPPLRFSPWATGPSPPSDMCTRLRVASADRAVRPLAWI